MGRPVFWLVSTLVAMFRESVCCRLSVYIRATKLHRVEMREGTGSHETFPYRGNENESEVRRGKIGMKGYRHTACVVDRNYHASALPDS
jgi:hypothetical protein